MSENLGSELILFVIGLISLGKEMSSLFTYKISQVKMIVLKSFCLLFQSKFLDLKLISPSGEMYVCMEDVNDFGEKGTR